MIDYTLYFEPHRPTEGDPNSPAVLVPVIVAEDGRRFVASKVVTTITGTVIQGWVCSHSHDGRCRRLR